METLFEIFLGCFSTLVVCTIVIGVFMLLSGRLSVGGSRGRTWKNQAEQNSRNRLRNVKFTKKEVQEYSNKYYNKK